MATGNWNDTTPPAPAQRKNVKWQADNNSPRNISAYMDLADAASAGGLMLASDLGGTALAPHVVGLQNRPLDSAVPSDGQLITWDNANSKWKPAGPAISSVFGRVGAIQAVAGDYTDALLGFTDITTGNASTSKHGFLKKLPNDATKFLDGTGAFSAPPSGAVSSVFGRVGAVVAAANDYTEDQISFSDITTNDASTSKHGYLKKLPNDATKFLDGTGAFSTPAGGSGFDPADLTVIWLIENWTGNITAANAVGNVGNLGWAPLNTSGTLILDNSGTSDVQHPYMIRLNGASVTGFGGGTLSLPGIGDAAVPDFGTASPTWDLRCKFRFGTLTHSMYYIGMVQRSWSVNAGATLGYESDAGGNLGASANMKYGVNGTAVDSGVAADTNWHRLRIRVIDSTHIGFTLDAGTETSVAVSGDDSQKRYPLFRSLFNGNGSADLFIAQWRMKITVTNP